MASWTWRSSTRREGSDGIALGPLLAKTGYTTFDQGFVNTASTKSAITYIDGDAGILRYRGYPIEQLAEKSTFIEVSYLLIYGELPTAEQLEAFTTQIQRHTLLHEDLKRFFDGFPRNAHPMPVLSSAVNALSAYYQDSLDPLDNKQVELSTIRLLAKLPTIAAYAYKKSVGPAVPVPGQLADPGRELPADDVRLPGRALRGRPRDRPRAGHAADPARRPRAELFDLDRATGRAPRRPTCSPRSPAASTRCGARCTAAPTRPCWRCWRRSAPATTTSRPSSSKVKNREDGVKLMGFGHRVYKNYDPRARIVKEQADKILGKLGGDDELLDIAKQLEEIALTDDFFIERKLYPNVDFYTGVIYRAMGFPTRMFTVLFALGRLPGWIAHWREMHEEPNKIGRPRQIYTGYGERDYATIDGR